MENDHERWSDTELLRRAVDGDDRAFATLMARHEDRVFSLALRMLGNRSDALDATQEAFISAFRRGRSFRGDAAFGTWLFRIAINTCKDLIRKRERWTMQDAEILERTEVTAGFEDAVIDRMQLRQALGRLPDEYRLAVVMHDLAGIPYEQIAALTGVQLGTVKSRISRGRRRLAELLEQRPPPPPSKKDENKRTVR